MSAEISRWKVQDKAKKQPVSMLDKQQQANTSPRRETSPRRPVNPTRGASVRPKRHQSPRGAGPPVWKANGRPETHTEEQRRQEQDEATQKPQKPLPAAPAQVREEDFQARSRSDSMDSNDGAVGFFAMLGDAEKKMLSGTEEMVTVAVATHAFVGSNERVHSFVSGETIKVVAPHASGWWQGELRGKTLMFPVNRTQIEDIPFSEWKKAALKSMTSPMFIEAPEDAPVVPPMRMDLGGSYQADEKAARLLGLGVTEEGSPTSKVRSGSIKDKLANLISPRKNSKAGSPRSKAGSPRSTLFNKGRDDAPGSPARMRHTTMSSTTSPSRGEQRKLRRALSLTASNKSRVEMARATKEKETAAAAEAEEEEESLNEDNLVY